jgi:hypothetical protein
MAGSETIKNQTARCLTSRPASPPGLPKAASYALGEPAVSISAVVIPGELSLPAKTILVTPRVLAPDAADEPVDPGFISCGDLHECLSPFYQDCK